MSFNEKKVNENQRKIFSIEIYDKMRDQKLTPVQLFIKLGGVVSTPMIYHYLNNRGFPNLKSFLFLEKELGIFEKTREAILKEYTFLKRPIIQIGEKFFVGNSKKVVEEAKNELW